MTICRRRTGIVAFAVIIALSSAAWAQIKAPDVGLDLYSSVEAVSPGSTFDVALAFKLPEEWHIYWENPGQSGMAPYVQWEAPPGFEIGPLRYPVPTRDETAGIVTYVLEGEPVLLARAKAPADLPIGKPVDITAKVRWLACKEACVPGSKVVKVSLPTARDSRPAGGKIADLFASAIKALPKPATEAKYAKLKATPSQSTVSMGDHFEVDLQLDIARGHHIQSNKPLQEYFIPTSVFPKNVQGLQAGQAEFPAPQFRNVQGIGRVGEFSGAMTIRIPVTVESPTLSREVTLGGLLRYQACEDSGRCFPPEVVEWSVPLQSASVRASAAGQPTDAQMGGLTPGSGSAAGDAGGDADVSAPAPQAPPASDSGVGAYLAQWGLAGYIIAGLIGGLILNIMPCVLPVVSIKILSFVQQASEEPKRVFQLGLVFSTGIVLSFWVMAGGILLLQHVTHEIRGWGAFFQEPAFVVAMVAVMFVFALSLFGAFEVVLPGSASSRLAGAAEREGFAGAFFKGALATLLATPCTAPILVGAIAWSFTQPAVMVFVIFSAVGVGMAAPYVLLTARPRWMRYIPKPGPWMVSFKQAMGFLLIGTVIWLLWVLSALLGGSGVVWTVAFLAFLALACWLVGRTQFSPRAGRKVTGAVAAVLIAALGGWFSYGQYTPEARSAAVIGGDRLDELVAAVDWSREGIPWIAFSKDLPERLASQGYTVYVDYTARWCTTCQLNKKVVFGSDDVRAQMARLGVIPIEADFTRYDPDIAADLNRFGRDAVPLNVIIPANRPGEPIKLPIVLTPGLVLKELHKAGPSDPRTAAVRHTPPREPRLAADNP